MCDRPKEANASGLGTARTRSRERRIARLRRRCRSDPITGRTLATGAPARGAGRLGRQPQKFTVTHVVPPASITHPVAACEYAPFKMFERWPDEPMKRSNTFRPPVLA